MNQDLLIRLFRTIEGDPNDDLVKIAHKIIEDEDKRGHSRLADRLKEILNKNIHTYSSFRGELKSLLPKGVIPTDKRYNIPLAAHIDRENLRHEMILPEEVESLLMFLIIFTWTPPHFWALAIARRGDYERAEIPMLPVTYGEELTKSFVVYYTVLLVIVTILPYLTGMSGPLYLMGALALGAGYLYYVIKLKVAPNPQSAMTAFRYSISYLMALFTFLLVDHYIPAIWPE